MKPKFMRVILERILLAVAFAVVLSACKNDESINPNAQKYGGSLTAMVNGEIIAMSQIGIYVYQGHLELRSKGSNSFSFEISNGIAKTTYDLKSGSGAALSYRVSGVLYSSIATDKMGEFVITEIDEANKTMSGTFQSTLQNVNKDTDSVTVSNGVFSKVPYVVQKENTGDTQLAMLDGVEFKGAIGTVSNTFSLQYNSGYQLLMLAFPYTETPVTYDVAELKGPYYNVTYVDGLYSYKATSGSIVITSVDVQNKKVEGTYDVVVESTPVAGTTKHLTGGVLSFKYP